MEKRVHFFEDYFWKPLDGRQTQIFYRAGWIGEVDGVCALQAINAGVAQYEEVLFALNEEADAYQPDDEGEE